MLTLFGACSLSISFLASGFAGATTLDCFRNNDPSEIVLAECIYYSAQETPAAGIRALSGLGTEDALAWKGLLEARLLPESGFEESLLLLEQSYEVFTERDLARGRLEALLPQLRIMIDNGFVNELDIKLRQAESLARGIGDDVVLSRFLLEAAGAYIKGLKDHSSAHRLLAELRVLDLRTGSRKCDRRCWYISGQVLYKLGRYEESVEAYDIAVKMTRAAGDIRNLTRARSNRSLARLYAYSRKLGDQEQARKELISEFSRILEAAIESGVTSVETKALFSLGKLSRAESSKEYLDRCVERAAATGDRVREIRCLLCRSVSEWEEDPDAAETDRSRAAARLVGEQAGGAGETSLGLDSGLFEVSTDALIATWKLDPRDEAIEQSQMWIDIIEASVRVHNSSLFRAQAFDVWSDLHASVIGRILRSREEAHLGDDVSLALDLQERMRSRELIGSLQRVGVSESVSDSSDTRPIQSAMSQSEMVAFGADSAEGIEELILERNRLDTEIVTSNQRLLIPGLDAAKRAELKASLLHLELDHSALQEKIRRLRAGAAGRSIERASLSDLASALAEGEALLSYQVEPNEDIYGDFAGGSWILVVTRDATHVVDLGDGRPLARSAEDFLAQFGKRSGQRRRSIQGDRKLYDDLVAPAIAVLPPAIDRLVMVPDGVLHLLPFGALRDPRGQVLTERFALSVVPSASLWLRWRRMPRPETDGMALVLADPVTPNTSAVAAGASVLRGVHDEAGKLPPLPAARLEGEAVVGHLHGASRLLTGRDASERALKQATLADYRVLHIAAHAIVEEENPDRSAVFLAPGADDEDGLLQMREIVDLDLEGRMVVLSACSSARGTVLRGEGVMSLARAFFAAGAPAVIGSLWPVADEPARQLFDAFYRHLADGASVADALRSAQLERIEAGVPAEDWASVEVFGDGAYVPFPRTFAAPWRAPALVAALGLLLLAIWLVRRRLPVQAAR